MDSIAEYSIYDIDGTEKCKVVAEENSVYHVELMKYDYVKLCFKLYDKKSFGLGDYIYLQSDGGKQKFEITEIQKPTYDTETGSYSYELQFNAECYKWGNKKYKYEPKNERFEASWALTDTLANHMEVLIRNLAYYGWDFTYNIKDVVNATKSIYIQFDNISILDALTKIAEAFDTEWIVSDNIITLGRVELGSDIELEQGVNVEKISASNSSQSYVTTLYAFGSTNNLPSNYRKSDSQVLLNGVVQKRLMLPKETPYVQLAGVSHTEESVEGIVTFDDVYPKMDNKVTEVKAVEKTINATDTIEADAGTTTDATDETSTTTKVNIYRIKDSSLSFKKEYILEGVTLQAVFSTGKLAGMVFDLAFNPDGESETVEITTDDGTKTTSVNADSQWFELVRNNTYGVDLPNDTLKPAEGDKFVLIGWDATKMDKLGLIEDAEKALLERTKEYAKKLQIDPSTYTCTMMSDYMYGLNDGQQDENYSMVGKFSIGQRVLLKSEAFLKTGSRESRVIGFEYKLDFPYDSFRVIIGENTAYSYRKDLEATVNTKFDSINFRGGTYNNNGSGNGGSNLYVITTTDVTTPTDRNVLSALRTERDFAHKRKNDNISALWTFENGYGARRGLQTYEYRNKANEDNLFGSGFELTERTTSNGGKRSRLEVDELLVRVKAFFAELEIRKISYVGGNYLFSAAGSKIYYVEWLDAKGAVLDKSSHQASEAYTFRCYLYSDNGTTATMNYFAADDQVICKTFNIDEGVHKNVSNKYWWRRATGVGKGAISALSDKTEYQYVDISMNDCDEKSDYPEENDTIVQLGNWTNSARQGAIYLMVEGESAPAIMEYSDLGANGKHFMLTKPTLQLSPKGNIIYGEFHSVNDTTTYPDGKSIDEQIEALMKQIAEIQAQADKKFDIYFEAYAPHPLKGEDFSTANYPASEWKTDALKALHVQDLFYDTDIAPASDGGRAWRWVSESTTGTDGSTTKTYYWEMVTDQDTISALEKARDLQNQVNDIVSDGVISKGSEKSDLLIEWHKAASNYEKYREQADDYSLLNDDVWKKYHDAFFTVATMLNNGTTYIEKNRTDGVTPAWLDVTVDTVLADTPTKNAATYRDTWNDYYTTFAAVLKLISGKAKELADNAQKSADEANGAIDDIVSDGRLDPSEKITIKRDFLAFYHELTDDNGLKDKGQDENDKFYTDGIETAYDKVIGCFNEVGTLLNGSVSWALGTVLDEDTLPVWLRNPPTVLTSTDKNEYITVTSTIKADEFRSKWSAMYAAKSAYIALLSEYAKGLADNAQKSADEKVQTFVTETVPDPPYKKGDMWIQTGNGNNVMISLADRESGDTTSSLERLKDWTDLSELSTKQDPRIQLAMLGDKIYELSGGYIQNHGKIAVVFSSNQPASATDGDLWFDGTNLRRYVSSSWSIIDSDSYAMAFKTVFDIVGQQTLTCFSSVQTQNMKLYDLVLRNIKWHDPFKDETVDGNVEVLMYNGKSWETLKECTRAIIDNLGDELRLVVFGSDGKGATDASGLVTRAMFSELFSQKVKDDKVVTESTISTWLGENDYLTGASIKSWATDEAGFVKSATLDAYVKRVSNGDGTYSLESDIVLSADKINFIGKTIINNKFWVDKDGIVYMDDANVSGTINATSGKIAGFSINGNGLVNTGFNNDAYVIFRNDTYNTFAGIGGNVLPASSGMRAVARFENHDKTNQWGLGYNVAVIMSAKKSDYNLAFAGNGNGFLAGYIAGYGFQEKTCDKENTCFILHPKESLLFIVDVTKQKASIGLPSLSEIRMMLGIGANEEFAVPIEIIIKTCPGDSYGGTFIYGKNKNIDGMNTDNYPTTDWTQSWTYGQTGSYIGNNDSFFRAGYNKFILSYRNSKYSAYAVVSSYYSYYADNS